MKKYNSYKVTFHDAYDDACCGQVYEWTPKLIKCNCCGNEKWETMEMDSHHDTPTQKYHLPDKS